MLTDDFLLMGCGIVAESTVKKCVLACAGLVADSPDSC